MIAAVNGVAMDSEFAISDEPTRRLEVGERLPEGKPVVGNCAVSGKYAIEPEDVPAEVPATLAARLVRARSLSVVLTARNLKLWTKYRGTDPESGYNTTSGTETPNEFQTVGPPSYFIVRFNLGY